MVVDKKLCKLYRERSWDFAQNIDVDTKKNIELLANLAVMALQFMHCCALDWRKRASYGGAAAGTCASDSQVLSSADANDDDDDDAGGD